MNREKRMKKLEPYDGLQCDAYIYAIEKYKESYNADYAVEETARWLVDKIDAGNYFEPYKQYSLIMSRVIDLFPWRF